MKTKSWKFLFTGVGSLVCGLLLLTACGKTGNGQSGNNPPVKEHTAHEWSESYIESGDRHYQPCNGCEEKKYGGHDFTNGDCVCGKEKPVEIHTHSMYEHKRVEPTCTAEGNVLYYSCSGCNKNFLDEDGKTELKEIGLPANGHSMSEHKRVEPTCTAEGNVLYYSCSGCNKNFSDKDGKTEVKEIGLRANGHSMTEHKRVEPTCAAGNVLYYSCSGCNHNFSDKDGQTELKEITIPATGLHVWDDNVCSICKHDAGGSKGLKWELSVDKSSYTVAGIGVCEETEITIPQTYNGLPVTAIGGKAFAGLPMLAVINIPNGIIEIEHGAFWGCGSLTSVIIPNSVTSLGADVFMLCTALTIYCEATEKPIGWEKSWSRDCPIVWDCNKNQMDSEGYAYAVIGNVRYSLKDGSATVIKQPRRTVQFISIPDAVTYEDVEYRVTSIANNAFEMCDLLEQIEISGSIVSIGDNIFAWCGVLESVTVSEENNKYASEEGILYNKSKTYLIFAPPKMRGAVKIPNSVTSIAGSAFQDCTLITDIEIPNSVTDIGSRAFLNCSSLKKIVIPEGVTGIRMMTFAGCSSLESVTIPNSVTGIWQSAFLECSSLTQVAIPDQVTWIGHNAFSCCTALTSVIISKSVKDIGQSVFDGCDSFKIVYFTGTTNDYLDISFSKWNENLTSATWYYYSETEPIEEGNYWHYDSDGVTPVKW